MFRRYACVRQHDQSDCGAAALATVAVHHGLPVAVQKVRDLAGTDRVGTNLLGLVEAAERFGFAAKGVQGGWQALREIPLPAIAHVRTAEGLGHFVVLHAVRRDGVVLADPARGVLRLSREEFCEIWTGYLVLLVPENLRAGENSGGSPTTPWHRFLALLAPHTRVLGEGFVCAMLLTVLGLSTSFFIRHLVDSVLVHNAGRLLNALGVGMLAIVVFRALFSALRQYLLIHVGRKVDLSLVSGYLRHVMRLPLGFFEMRRVGEILSRVNDTAKVRAAIGGTTLSALVDGTLIVITSVVMFLYDWPLALVAFLFVPVLIASVLVHHPGAKKRSREAMEKAAKLQAHMVEDIAGVETAKAFGVERGRSEEGDQRLAGVVQAGFSLELLGLSLASISVLVKGAASVAVLWYGGHRALAGELSIGELVFFHTLLGYMLEPLERLTSVNLSIQEALVAVDRLYQILDLEMEKDGEGKADLPHLRKGIELHDVCFRYGCRANVLQDIDLEIPAGRTVAIVGESGSGKSTLLKLLLRYYEPTSGSVRFDGLDARDIALSSLRSRIGLVSQDPFLFTGTIRENIALGRPDATMAEVVEAARAAELDEFIAGLPERYETIVGERGANLSGGQRQRLAIARALLQRPDILVFDEATSHLDTATELAIQRSLRTSLRGKTVVLVAHRLSTIRDADMTYLLERGRIVEKGTHTELVARGGRYAALWRAQIGEAPARKPVSGPPPIHKANGKKLALTSAHNSREF